MSIFAERSQTPILFTYLEGVMKLWPKGQNFAKPGVLTLHVGPVHPPAPIEDVQRAYREWVMTINPAAYHPVTEEVSHDASERKD